MMRRACGVVVAGVLAIAALTQPTRAADEDAPAPLNFDFPTAVALCADSANKAAIIARINTMPNYVKRGERVLDLRIQKGADMDKQKRNITC